MVSFCLVFLVSVFGGGGNSPAKPSIIADYNNTKQSNLNLCSWHAIWIALIVSCNLELPPSTSPPPPAPLPPPTHTLPVSPFITSFHLEACSQTCFLLSVVCKGLLRPPFHNQSPCSQLFYVSSEPLWSTILSVELIGYLYILP